MAASTEAIRLCKGPTPRGQAIATLGGTWRLVEADLRHNALASRTSAEALVMRDNKVFERNDYTSVMTIP